MWWTREVGGHAVGIARGAKPPARQDVWLTMQTHYDGWWASPSVVIALPSKRTSMTVVTPRWERGL